MKPGVKAIGTIKGEIFLLSFIFLTLVSAIFSGVFLRILYLNNIASAKNSLKECNTQMLIYAEGIFHENESIIKILAGEDNIIHGGYGNPSSVTDAFEEIIRNNQNITYIYAGYQDGRLLLNNYALPKDFNLDTRPWYQAALSSEGVSRLVYKDAATNEWLFSQSLRLCDSQGNITGAISIDCSNENITAQLSSKYQYESQRSFIISPDGTILIHPDEQEVNAFFWDYMDKKIWESIINEETNYAEYIIEDQKTMAYFEQIPESDFIIATAINASEVVYPIIYSMVYFLFLLIGISIVLGFILSRILIYRFAKPIMALGGKIQNIASGAPNKQPDFKYSNAEINHIAEGIELIVKDIANREEQRKAAEYLSFHDSMTGLYNRRFFEAEKKRLDTAQHYPLCIFCCDINGLKLVNDVFGHETGDQLICSVAQCLREEVRPKDVVARVGGDEFSILMPLSSEKDARKLLRSIKKRLATVRISVVNVSISMGYAVKSERTESLEVIEHKADTIMYRNKVTESVQMKQNTVNSMIKAAQKEKLARTPSKRENYLLTGFSKQMFPEGEELLIKSYQFRNIGLCTLFHLGEENRDEIKKHHTETGYRVLSMLKEYCSVAGFVLHYTEHWDGSGGPVGLSGKDIPLFSRMIAVIDAYFASGETLAVFETHPTWYDPGLVLLLKKLIQEKSAP